MSGGGGGGGSYDRSSKHQERITTRNSRTPPVFTVRCPNPVRRAKDGEEIASSYDEVARVDGDLRPADEYTYACPCGDIFRITLEERHDGEEIAKRVPAVA